MTKSWTKITAVALRATARLQAFGVGRWATLSYYSLSKESLIAEDVDDPVNIVATTCHLRLLLS